MPVVVAVDFGEKRIGLATSDASGLLATPRVTLAPQERPGGHRASSPGSAARKRRASSSSGFPARPRASRAPSPRASGPSPSRFAGAGRDPGALPRGDADLQRGLAAPAAAGNPGGPRPDRGGDPARGLPAERGRPGSDERDAARPAAGASARSARGGGGGLLLPGAGVSARAPGAARTPRSSFRSGPRRRRSFASSRPRASCGPPGWPRRITAWLAAPRRCRRANTGSRGRLPCRT